MISATPSVSASQWQASLSLQFAQTARGCKLIHSTHQGPLYIQKPFYPEGADFAHIYLLHPPGGLVSGDKLSISVQLQPEAGVLLTTPGAGRVYRARSDRSLQQQCINMTLDRDAVMEYLPQETIVYPAAHARLDTRIELAPGSRVIAWEICCLGLPSSNSRFTEGELCQRLSVFAGKKPLLIERFELNDRNRALHESALGLRGQPVTAVMLAGPFDREKEMDSLLETVRVDIAGFQKDGLEKPTALCAVSVLNDFVVARYLGSNADEAKRMFIRLWQVLRPRLIDREACSPRIWSV